MKIAFFDCQSGISGDMILGSLIDLGLDIKKIRAGLKSLDLPDYQIRVSKTSRGSIIGSKVDVVLKRGKHSTRHSRKFPQIKKIINVIAIALSNSTRAYDKLYTYKIPDSLFKDIKEGVRVYVPFGSGEKIREGIVFDIGKF